MRIIFLTTVVVFAFCLVLLAGFDCPEELSLILVDLLCILTWFLPKSTIRELPRIGEAFVITLIIYELIFWQPMVVLGLMALATIIKYRSKRG